MSANRLALAIDSLVHHAREEGIAYAAGGCVRDLDAEKRTEAARHELRAALPAEGATGARGASDRASDKWRGREEIAARDYWHAHANGQPICEPWLDGWLSRAKAHSAPADAGAALEREVVEAAVAWGMARTDDERSTVNLLAKVNALAAHRAARPA